MSSFDRLRSESKSNFEVEITQGPSEVDSAPLPGHIRPESHSRVSEPRLAQIYKDGFTMSRKGSVAWTENHPLHPRSWSLKRKLYDTGIMFVLELFTTIISNTGSLSALEAHERLNISKETAIFAFASTYLIGQAVGCVIFPPYTESYGRKPTYITAALLFAISTLIVGASGHIAGIIIGRLISGLVSAIPTVVLSGSIEDMWSIKARIWVVDIWVLCGVFGVSIAPSFATGIAFSNLGWKWIYYFAAIGSSVLVAAICFIKESRPSQILRKYVNKLDAVHSGQDLNVEGEDIMPSFKVFVNTGLKKPIHLFWTEPIIVVITLMSASVYATAYLLTEALPKVYSGFGYSPMESGRVYLTLCIGAVLALSVRFWDVHVSERREKKGEKMIPEDKLLGFFIAAPLQAIAFWWFAWTIPPHARHLTPTISIISIVPMGFAINEFDHVLTGYLIDTYTSVAGSACAPLGFVRAILSAIFPIIGSKMFDKMDNNIAASILAIVATIYLGIAVAFFYYGKRFREASSWVKAHAEKDGHEIRPTHIEGQKEKP